MLGERLLSLTHKYIVQAEPGDHETAKLLNAAIRKTSLTSAPSSSSLKMDILGRLKPNFSKSSMISTVPDESNNEITSFASTMQASNIKQKRAEPRPDEYDVVVSPAKGATEEQAHLDRPAKRRKGPQAKKPIIISKTAHKSPAASKFQQQMVREVSDISSGVERSKNLNLALQSTESRLSTQAVLPTVPTVTEPSVDAHSSNLCTKSVAENDAPVGHVPIQEDDEWDPETVFDISLLQIGTVDMGHVGHSYIENRWISKMPGLQMENALRKDTGRNIKLLHRELRAYGEAKGSKSEEHTNVCQESVELRSRKISNQIGLIVDGMVGKRAGDVEESNSQEELLNDIYFILLPDLLRAIKYGVEVYSLYNKVNIAEVQRICQLLSSFCELGEAALAQPSEEVSRHRGYQYSKPTSRTLPKMRGFLSRLRGMLRQREQMRKREANFTNARAKRERQNLERATENTRMQDRRTKLEEQIRASQIQVCEERLADPIWGPLLRIELARSKMATNRPISAAELERSTQNDNVIDGEDPFLDDTGGFQRVSVFPKNKVPHHNRPQPLSKDERLKFLEFLRFEKGHFSLNLHAYQ